MSTPSNRPEDLAGNLNRRRGLAVAGAAGSFQFREMLMQEGDALRGLGLENTSKAQAVAGIASQLVQLSSAAGDRPGLAVQVVASVPTRGQRPHSTRKPGDLAL